MNRYELRDVRDPELAHQLLELAGVTVDQYTHDPATRLMEVFVVVDRYAFEAAAVKQGLTPEFLISTRGILRQRGAL